MKKLIGVCEPNCEIVGAITKNNKEAYKNLKYLNK